MRVTVVPATATEMEQVVAWLVDPAIYRDAFWLAARPDPAWIRRSLLVVKNGLGIELQAVRLWAVRHAAGTGVREQLVGVAIDYGWDHADDPVRELDVALPAAAGHGTRLVLRTFVTLLHRLFHEHGAGEAIARVRAGGSGEGFPRLFGSIGAEEVHRAVETHPLTGERALRVRYHCTPESFYASRLGRRSPPPG